MLSFEGQRWRVIEGAPTTYITQASTHGLICDIAHARGVKAESLASFLSPSTDHFHDPFLFTHMRRACERIFDAIERHERIMIHGDYDADGIGGSVILYETISALGGDVDVFLPHRDEDGYGMHMDTARRFADERISVVITCDCGIANVDETDFLQSHGVDVIITDHHQFKEILPPACALLHPSLPEETYPDKTLSGGGVAYKFAHGLLRFGVTRGHATMPDSIEHFLYSRLDLAAMSTIADMVPLLGESRIIAHMGLQRLRTTTRPGFLALLSKISSPDFSAETYSFGIAPKVNSPGRMGNPRVAFDLLSTSDEARAYALLADIEQINAARRRATKEALDEAVHQVESEGQQSHPILFAYADHWPSGIAGLIAGRLKDMFHKPALVMAGRASGIVGSGRSTSAVHIVRALDEVRDCLGKYGGHPQACGFSLKDPSLLPYFEDRLRRVVANMIDPDEHPELIVDVSMKLSDISWTLMRDVMRLAPFGVKHEKPRFLIENVQVTQARAIGSSDKTLLLHLKDDSGNTHSCVGFGKSHYMTRFHLGDRVDAVVELDINSYNGKQEIQCMLVDMRMHD